MLTKVTIVSRGYYVENLEDQTLPSGFDRLSVQSFMSLLVVPLSTCVLVAVQSLGSLCDARAEAKGLVVRVGGYYAVMLIPVLGIVQVGNQPIDRPV